jgi:hypothetical protein
MRRWVHSGLSSPSGGRWPSGCSWRLRTRRFMPHSTSTFAAIWTARCARWRRPSWPPRPTVPVSTCIRSPRMPLQKASSRIPSSRSSLRTAPYGWHPSIRHLPPLVGHELVKAALEGAAPLVSVILLPGRLASDRLVSGAPRRRRSDSRPARARRARSSVVSTHARRGHSPAVRILSPRELPLSTAATVTDILLRPHHAARCRTTC